MLNKIRIIELFLIMNVLMMYACGYRFAGTGAFPENVDKIFIEVFENRTSKTGIERVVTNQLIFEFTRQRERSLAGDAGSADAILKGVIQTVRTKTISRVGTEAANEREVIMSVDLRLINQSGDVIWVARGLSDRQAYNVSELKLESDRNEDLAIATLSERISERIFSRLTDDF